MKTENKVQALSQAFSRLLNEYLSIDELNEIREKNNQPEYGESVCASHDYLDANEVMAEAFKEVTGHEVNPLNENDTQLWNAAWKESKGLSFYNGY